MAKKLSKLEIGNAQILFRNFAGVGTNYNPVGKRNFCVLLDESYATVLKEDGWNVKYLKPKEEEDAPQAFLKVNVSYATKSPIVMLISNNKKTRLTEETVNVLDYAEIEYIDLIIDPFSWDMNGRSGIGAYLSAIYVTIKTSELEDKYFDMPFGDSAYVD